MSKKINEQSLKICLTNIKIKSLNSFKSKVAHLLRFMAIHIKRIVNTLVIVAKIIIIQEREILNLTKKSLENSRKSSHQPLMVKLRRGKRQNPGCPGWRNTFKFITTLINWKPGWLFIISWGKQIFGGRT